MITFKKLFTKTTHEGEAVRDSIIILQERAGEFTTYPPTWTGDVYTHTIKYLKLLRIDLWFMVLNFKWISVVKYPDPSRVDTKEFKLASKYN